MNNTKKLLLTISLVGLVGSPTAIKANWLNALKHPAALVSIGAAIGFCARHMYTPQTETIITRCTNWFWTQLGYSNVQPTPATLIQAKTLSRVNSERLTKRLSQLGSLKEQLEQSLVASTTFEVPNSLRLTRTPPGSAPRSASSTSTTTTTTSSPAIVLLERRNSTRAISGTVSDVRSCLQDTLRVGIKNANEIGARIISTAFELCDNPEAPVNDILLLIINESKRSEIQQHFQKIAEQTRRIITEYNNIEQIENSEVELTALQIRQIETHELAIDNALSIITKHFAALVEFVNSSYKQAQRHQLNGLLRISRMFAE